MEGVLIGHPSSLIAQKRLLKKQQLKAKELEVLAVLKELNNVFILY